jgi:hypothetical protein
MATWWTPLWLLSAQLTVERLGKSGAEKIPPKIETAGEMSKGNLN